MRRGAAGKSANEGFTLRINRRVALILTSPTLFYLPPSGR